MAIIKNFSILFYVPQSIKTIARKNNNIIVSQHGRTTHKSIPEDKMAISFCKYWFSECNLFSSKSKLSWIKASIRKKSRNQVSMECLCHKSHESLSSSTIQKSIMQYCDFWFCTQNKDLNKEYYSYVIANFTKNKIK